MAPHWAEIVGWVFLGAGFASALAIAVDELVLGHRQHMWIMNLVHPITALYLGPAWLWAYAARGRAASRKAMEREAAQLAAADGVDTDELRRRGQATEGPELEPWHVANAVSHCGAGCTLGDICGEWVVWATGWTIAGATLYPELILDFPIAWTLGVVFQYFTIVPAREGVGKLKGLWLAVRADTLSILAFQLGLFAWMALSAKVIWTPPLGIDTSAHWWMMQTGMIVGFCTSWPVNRWLVSRGWKEKMDHRPHVADMVDARSGRGRRRPPRPAATG